ncbi:hypothetical protein RGAI101_2693 [Roseobacter sp. GAI101]|nr:hypothetical protein RGAI101_2693 [Roseobacter sp. GAI101]
MDTIEDAAFGDMFSLSLFARDFVPQRNRPGSVSACLHGTQL